MGVEPISGVDNLAAVHDYTGRKAYQAAEREQETRRTDTLKESSVKVSVQPNAAAMGKFGGLSEEKNDFAKSIRATDTALGKVSELLERMRTPLKTIVKNYPPFPADSQDRKNLLMEYVSLRKEIEKLMVPPPPKPVYENNVRLWEKLGYADAETLRTGFPEVTSSSSDMEVAGALDGLDELLAVVSDGRSELVRSVTG